MRRKLVPLLLGMALALGLTTAVPVTVGAHSDSDQPAPGPITVQLNAQDIELEEAPVLKSGRVFVPLRGVLEQLGVSVTYDSEAEKIQLSRGGDSVVIELVDNLLTRGDELEPIEIVVPPFIEDGRAYVPLRFVAEIFGERVDWLSDQRKVAIWSAYLRSRQEGVDSARPDDSTPVLVDYTDEEFELLVRVINAEAYGEPFDGQVAVGAVVINRVLHPGRYFPNTLAEVIYQPNQFMVVHNGQIHREVADVAYKAARAALSGQDPSNGALYFYNPDKVSSDFLVTRPILIRIGDHVFAH